MNTYGGVDVYIHVFLTSSLLGDELSASRLGRFTPEESTRCTYWIGGGVSSTAGLDDVEKIKFLTLPGLELQPLCRPTRNQSLYQLRYSGSQKNKYNVFYISFRFML
jgi:hypothetical protein